MLDTIKLAQQNRLKFIKWIIAIIVFIFTSCSSKRIEITTEYILNENWGKEWSRPIFVEKMNVKRDSTINPFSDISQVEILSKLDVNSLFKWLANANTSSSKEEIYRTKKIYFGKDNGFIWSDDVSHKEARVFGNLEAKTWYRFAGLVGYPYFVYVYIDSINQAHRFDVNLANY